MITKEEQSVCQLASRIAHDLNNLLCVMSGYSELVCGSLRPGDPLRNMLNEVRTAGERAAGLTQQLLYLGRNQAEEVSRY